MDKLKLHTPDLTIQNIEKLAALFPNCVTEAKDEKSGKLRRAIDFDQLRQELSDHLVEGPRERYHLDWPGKREALLAANAPIAKTLRPCREESVDFDTTKNLFIEGDNLDALKLLQETYLGKIKLIYIDPPYNTGNDFIYVDDFVDVTESYLVKSNQTTNENAKLVTNPESNGRFHSDWLTMMIPRLKLARPLLRDDGCIAVSIGDEEVAQLKHCLDEIYGATNRVGIFVISRSEGGGMAKQVVRGHDYLLIYAKSVEHFSPLRRPRDIRGQVVDVGGVEYWIEEDWLRREFGEYGTCEYHEIETFHGQAKKLDIDAGLKSGKYRLVRKNDGRVLVGRLREVASDSSKFYSLQKHLNAWGNEDLNELQMNGAFDYPKPVSLVRDLILGATFASKSKEDVVLDFFAGSSTTAHAVMERNLGDNGNRRFIMVQLPVPLEENNEKHEVAIKFCKTHGVPQNLAGISKERIRRAGTKIKAENATTARNLDLGFRVLKIDTSNMKDVYYAPDETKQGQLEMLTDNIKEKRTPEDLLFQVLVDWGLDLALPITQVTIAKKKVFFVDGNALAACFDPNITEELVKELAKNKPLRAVFRDSSYGSDSIKINVEQIFKLLSPGTELKSL